MSVMRVIAFGRSCSYIHYVKLWVLKIWVQKCPNLIFFGKRIQVFMFAIFKHIPGLIKRKTVSWHKTNKTDNKWCIPQLYSEILWSFAARRYDCSAIWVFKDNFNVIRKKKNSRLPFNTIKSTKKASLDRISINLSIKTKSSTAVSFVFLNHVSTVTTGLLNFPLNWQTSDILCGVWKIWHDLVTNRR